VDGNKFLVVVRCSCQHFITPNSNHTFAGNALQTNGGGIVTIAPAASNALTLFSSANGQGIFVGGVSAQTIDDYCHRLSAIPSPLSLARRLGGTAGSLFSLRNNSALTGGVQLIRVRA